MARVKKAIATILLCTSSLISATITGDRDKLYFDDLQKVFDVDFTSDKPGSCKQWQSRLEVAYKEALYMLTAAIEAVTLVDEEEPQQGKEELVEKRGAWLKGAQTWRAMFGEYPDEPGAVKHLAETGEKFQQLMKAHQISPNTPPKWHLRCNDDFFKFLDPMDKDPRDKGTANEGKFSISYPAPGREAFPDGVWYAASLPGKKAFMLPEIDEGKETQHPICEDVLAASLWHQDLVLFCPLALDGPEPSWSMDLMLASIKEGDSVDTFRNTLANTWIHEMGHYAMNWDDHAAIDRQGNAVAVPERGHDPRVYGWRPARHLAEYEQEKARASPENYALFALTIYAKDWSWSRGVAQCEPEEGAVWGEPMNVD